MSRKFDVGDTCRLTKAIPQTIKNMGLKAGTYGKVVKAKYDEVAQHTMYTVQVGTKRIVVRGTALNTR